MTSIDRVVKLNKKVEDKIPDRKKLNTDKNKAVFPSGWTLSYLSQI